MEIPVLFHQGFYRIEYFLFFFVLCCGVSGCFCDYLLYPEAAGIFGGIYSKKSKIRQESKIRHL